MNTPGPELATDVYADPGVPTTQAGAANVLPEPANVQERAFHASQGRPWFGPEHPERLEVLAREALAWVGTPFFPNSSARGQGVSCQKLVAAIYRAVGFCDVDVPDVPMALARFSERGLVEPYLARMPMFERLVRAEVSLVQPGDLLGFRLARIVHHLGICVEPGRFVHAIEHLGTTLSTLADPTWAQRLAIIWRPILTP